MWESLLAKYGIDALKAGIKSARKKISKDEYSELISEAIRELLKLHPNITAAEAKIIAADALEIPSSSEMLTAKSMLTKIKRKGKKKSVSAGRVRRIARKSSKKKAKKKTASKKKAKKKMSRKRASRRR